MFSGVTNVPTAMAVPETSKTTKWKYGIMASTKIPKYPDDFMDHHRMNRVMRHHLRNLCAGVKMTVERISAMTAAVNPQIGARCDIVIGELDILRRFTDRMDLLFDSLPRPEPLSLFELISVLRRSFAARFPFCTLELDGPEAALTLPHGSWVNLALDELLANSGDAAGENGNVRLTWQIDSGVVFTLTNHGDAFPAEIPIDPPVPFYTTRSRRDGLGIAIAYRIAGELGGAWSLHHGNGEITVTLTLPATEALNE